MTQPYDFNGAETCPSATSTGIQPSEQAVKTILAFARSYQVVEVEGMKIDVYLN